jgi:hypothetical protein
MATTAPPLSPAVIAMLSMTAIAVVMLVVMFVLAGILFDTGSRVLKGGGDAASKAGTVLTALATVANLVGARRQKQGQQDGQDAQ